MFTRMLAAALVAAALPAGAAGQEPETEPAAEPEVSWLGERAEFVRRAYFAPDPWSGPIEPAGEPRPELGPVYFWTGTEVWLVVEVEAAPEGGTLCAVWSDPAGEPTAEGCQLLPAGPARLAFAGPETGGWPQDRYTVRLVLHADPTALGAEPLLLADVHFALGERAMGTRNGPENGGEHEEIPTFPWPPPRPTTRTVLEREMAAGDASTLGGVADRLAAALGRAGYAERSFYAAPGGYALVTRLEQIEFDGTPKPEPERWSAALPAHEIFSLSDFVRALFTAPEGHYRVIVFVVSDRPFATAEEEATREQAEEWLGGGLDRLPEEIAETPFGAGHACTALVYQFRKVGHEREPIANPDGAPPAERQLERTGILGALGG